MYESTYTSETLKNFFNCLDITILRAMSEEKGTAPAEKIVRLVTHDCNEILLTFDDNDDIESMIGQDDKEYLLTNNVVEGGLTNNECARP